MPKRKKNPRNVLKTLIATPLYFSRLPVGNQTRFIAQESCGFLHCVGYYQKDLHDLEDGFHTLKWVAEGKPVMQCAITKNISVCNFVKAESDMSMRLETCDFCFCDEINQAIHAIFEDARKFTDLLDDTNEHFVIGTIHRIMPRKLSDSKSQAKKKRSQV
jgi:hypothetical protein